MVPSGATVAVSAPADTKKPGSPKRAWSAGVSKKDWWPFPRKVTEPSGKTVCLKGPDRFAVMVFPLAGLVSEAFRVPVTRMAMDPSAVLSALTSSLPTSSVAWISNPQNTGSTVTVGGTGTTCHPPPRPSARAGAAVTTPPNRPSSAPSATITPTRLMAITPSAPPHCGPVPDISSSRRTGRGVDGRHRPPYRLLGAASIMRHLFLRQFGDCLNTALPCRTVRPHYDMLSVPSWRECRGRYHTDRQPGDASQYTARCPGAPPSAPGSPRQEPSTCQEDGESERTDACARSLSSRGYGFAH